MWPDCLLEFFVQRINEKRNHVVITDRMWARLVSSTNQPSFLGSVEIAKAKEEEHPPTQLLEGENCNDEKRSNENNTNGN